MRILTFLGLNGIALGLFGQPPITPAFEVASVKLNQLDTRGFIGAVPGGKGFRGFKATSARLKILVMLAYNLPDSQITGGPGWVESDGFDIDAKAENPTSYEQINLMLQTLLADRFQLRIRRETREQPVYALILEKPSPNLVPHADDGTLPVIRVGSTPGERIFENMPIARLAMLLRGETGRTVVDKTGLEGSYDFKVEYASNLSKGPREENAPSELGQSVFAAVRKLGLKLESQKGPSEYLTIEHVEKPSAN
jgi:uncharacterized protein (TIGR03435 family)